MCASLFNCCAPKRKEGGPRPRGWRLVRDQVNIPRPPRGRGVVWAELFSRCGPADATLHCAGVDTAAHGLGAAPYPLQPARGIHSTLEACAQISVRGWVSAIQRRRSNTQCALALRVARVRAAACANVPLGVRLRADAHGSDQQRGTHHAGPPGRSACVVH